MKYEARIDGMEMIFGNLVLKLPIDPSNVADEYKKDGKNWVVTISKKKEKRSLEANSYLWVIADAIARELSKDGTVFTKEEVYRKAIREVGVFTFTVVQDTALDDFIAHWNGSGIGNFAEKIKPAKDYPNCTVVRVFYGSSTYNTAEMSRVIDYLTQEAKTLGIEMLTADELAEMVQKWG